MEKYSSLQTISRTIPLHIEPCMLLFTRLFHRICHQTYPICVMKDCASTQNIWFTRIVLSIWQGGIVRRAAAHVPVTGSMDNIINLAFNLTLEMSTFFVLFCFVLLTEQFWLIIYRNPKLSVHLPFRSYFGSSWPDL